MGRFKHEQGGRRQYYQNKKSDQAHAQNYQSTQNLIQIGQYGFFITFCASKESFVRNEIYNLLNRFADQTIGPEFTEETEDKEKIIDPNDLDAALENEKSKLNETKKKIRRFQIVKSGTKHSLFVRTTIPLESINPLIESIFNTCIQSKEQHSRYVERLLPVSFICKAYDDDLRKTIVKSEFLDQLLAVGNDGNSNESNTIWFDVQTKKSNNNQIKCSQLEEILINDLISRKAEDCQGKLFKRDYKKPYLHVLLHVIKNLILISIVRHYDSFKKYNLASINLATVTKEETTTETAKATKITFDDDANNEDDAEEAEENEKET